MPRRPGRSGDHSGRWAERKAVVAVSGHWEQSERPTGRPDDGISILSWDRDDACAVVVPDGGVLGVSPLSRCLACPDWRKAGKRAGHGPRSGRDLSEAAVARACGQGWRRGATGYPAPGNGAGRCPGTL